MLTETSPTQLEEGATLLNDVADLITRLRQHYELFLLCRVESDIGEAAVRGCLEGEGVCGRGKGQVSPHRVLFCGTTVGSTSMVRQLEPDLHIDGDVDTVCCVWMYVCVRHMPCANTDTTGAGAAAFFATADACGAKIRGVYTTGACRVLYVIASGTDIAVTMLTILALWVGSHTLTACTACVTAKDTVVFFTFGIVNSTNTQDIN